jgi:hypothetical protein
MKVQYDQFNSIYSELKVRWFPTLGNHDIWQYNSTFEESKPTGDHLFGQTFKSNFQNYPGLTYNDKTSWNPESNVQSWFQNYEIRVGDVVFICLDWISREPAMRSLGYKGAMPTAMLHDFPNGTLPFLSHRLSLLKEYKPKQVIFIQHHPFRSPAPVPSEIYGFGSQKKRIFRELLAKHYNAAQYFGIFGGHWHRWYEGNAFDEWTHFKQYEPNAVKNRPSIILVKVVNSQISSVTKYME